MQHLYDDVALFPPSLSFIYMLLYIQSIFLWRCWAFVCTSFSASSGHILLWQFSTFLVSLLFSVLALFSLPSSDVDSSVLPKCNRASYWIYIFNILDFFCDCPKRFLPFYCRASRSRSAFSFPASLFQVDWFPLVLDQVVTLSDWRKSQILLLNWKSRSVKLNQLVNVRLRMR